MNNTVENDFFGFPKVKWLQYTGKVGNVQAIDVKFSQDLTQQKSLKSVNFRQSCWKNKRWTFFGTQCITYHILHCFRDIAIERSKIAIFGYPSGSRAM